MRIIRTAIVVFATLLLTSCFPYWSHVSAERSLGVKVENDKVKEEIIEKDIAQSWFALLDPEGKFFNYIIYKKYYLRSGNEEDSLSMLNTLYMDVPYKTFYSVPDSDLWVYIITTITGGGDFTDNRIIVFNKDKKLYDFYIRDCTRSYGGYGIQILDNRLYYQKFGDIIEYDAKTNSFKTFKD